MKIEWTEFPHAPGYIYAVVDGFALGYIRYCSSGWYAKYDNIARMNLGLPDRAAAEAELEQMIQEYEDAARSGAEGGSSWSGR